MDRTTARLLVATFALAGCASPDPCIAAHRQRTSSPSGSRRVIVFTGPCPGEAPQVLVEFRRSGGGGGVFAADDSVVNLRARWVGEDTVEISYPASARVSKKDSVVQHATERVVLR